VSIWQNLFIGPFAEWLVPEGKAKGLPPRDEDGELLFSEKLAWDSALGEFETVVRHKKRYRRFCCMPRDLKPESHGREVLFGGQPAYPGNQDLLDVDRQGEIDWFAKAFARELKVLAEKFGGEPTFHWGLVCWPS
jgi:hypothetical protein